MAESRMNEVAQELLRLSNEKKVDWEESGKRDSYRVFFPDVALIITRERTFGEDFREYLGYQLDLMSEAGRTVDSLAPEPEEPSL